MAVIATVLTLTVVVAVPLIGEESNHKEVTLDSLEKRILDYNLDILRADEALIIAEYKNEQAEDDENKAASSAIETSKNIEYYIRESEMAIDYAKWAQADVKEATVLEGVKQYFTYQLLMDEIELQQSKVARLEDILESVNVKIDLGKATINNRTTAELDVERESYNLQVLINNRDRLFMDLNVLMNYDLDTPLVFETIKLPYTQYETKSIDDDLENVLETNGALKKIDDTGDLAAMELQIYQKYNNRDEYDKEIIIMKENISAYRLDFKDEELSLEYDVRSDYNAVLNAHDTFLIKKLEIDNMKMLLTTVEKRFELGLETNDRVEMAKENYNYANLALDQSKLDYYIAVEAYKNFVD